MSPVGKVSMVCLSSLIAAAVILTPTSVQAFTGPLALSAKISRSRAASSGVRSTSYGQERRARLPALSMGMSMTEAESTAAVMDEDVDSEEGSGVFAAIRPLTEGPVFIGLQAIFVVALAGLIDAGFSGDWQARGYLSDTAADTARVACYTAAAAHVVLTGVSAFIAQAKGADLATAAITLATGPLGFLKVAAMRDQDELEALAANNAPPLSMVINTMELSKRQTPACVLLSTSITAKKGREGSMRNLLETLVNETLEDQKQTVLTCTVNQDPEDRRNFFLLQRFSSPEAMSAYQNTETFRTFTDGAEDCVAEPMGLYMVNERSGKLGEPVHPFGPGGEGGRDDAIYSSPANLQGSLMAGF